MNSGELDNFLLRASDIKSKRELNGRNKKKRNADNIKAIEEDIIDYLSLHDINSCADFFSISPITVAKVIIKAYKKEKLNNIERFIEQHKIDIIENKIYRLNTTSIKKIVSSLPDNIKEYEVRLVKAMIEKRGQNWDF